MRLSCYSHSLLASRSQFHTMTSYPQPFLVSSQTTPLQCYERPPSESCPSLSLGFVFCSQQRRLHPAAELSSDICSNGPSASSMPNAPMEMTIPVETIHTHRATFPIASRRRPYSCARKPSLWQPQGPQLPRITGHHWKSMPSPSPSPCSSSSPRSSPVPGLNLKETLNPVAQPSSPPPSPSSNLSSPPNSQPPSNSHPDSSPSQHPAGSPPYSNSNYSGPRD